jgi:hypothetical protein
MLARLSQASPEHGLYPVAAYGGGGQTARMLTAFGVSALTFMMLMYAFERRHPGFIVAFACGCALASLYGFLSGAWPFGVVEAIWAGVAIHRFANRNAKVSY